MKAEMMFKYLLFPVRLIVVLILFLQSIPVLCQVDSLEFWSYTLHTYSKTKADKSIGRITFFRSKPVHERGGRDQVYQGECFPSISYLIYDRSDSVACKNLANSRSMRFSCWLPTVFGEMIQAGPYIFLNRDACASCVSPLSGIDYCRPTVNKILTNVNLFKTKTLEEFVQQFGIQGKIN